MTRSVPSAAGGRPSQGAGNPSPARVETRRPLPLRWWLGVLVLALLIRAGWGTFRLLTANDPSALEFSDEQQYWSMAGALRAGDGLRDELGFQATRMPLYPAFLSLFAAAPNGVAIAKVFHWMIGAVAAMLTAGVAASLFGNRVGLLAGLLAACDPFQVFFSSLLLTETPFLAALVGLWWLVERAAGFGLRGDPRRGFRPSAGCRRREETDWKVGPTTGSTIGRWVAVGAAAAGCVYLRESSVGLVAVLFVMVVACRRFDRRVLLGAAIAGSVVFASLLPWAARNQRVMGEWCWLTTRGGVSLYDGVRPQATGASDLAEVQQMPDVEHLGEAEWNRYFLSESWKAMTADPQRILRLARTKLARMWNPFPNVETYQSRAVRIISAAWTVPIFTLAVIAVVLLPIREKRAGVRNVLFLLLPALYLSVLHSLFVGSVRYRLGAMPMLEILAAFALIAMIDAISNYRLRIRVASAPWRT